jgi:hypothetical protein
MEKGVAAYGPVTVCLAWRFVYGLSQFSAAATLVLAIFLRNISNAPW